MVFRLLVVRNRSVNVLATLENDPANDANYELRFEYRVMFQTGRIRYGCWFKEACLDRKVVELEEDHQLERVVAYGLRVWAWLFFNNSASLQKFALLVLLFFLHPTIILCCSLILWDWEHTALNRPS